MKINDRVREDIKKLEPEYTPDPDDLFGSRGGKPVLMNPNGWYFGTITEVAVAETCPACGQDVPDTEPRWRVKWENGRETVQYESTLVLLTE